MSEFFQSAPELHHPYETDPLLRPYLKERFPPELFAEVDADLRRFGTRVLAEVEPLGVQAEAEPPRHAPYDPWGQRVDHIATSPAWQALDAIAAQEGLVSLGYSPRFGAHARLYQFAKLYLFHPASAIYTCPLAMTDGAARAIQLYGDKALQAHALPHLLSNDPSLFWTSGQWMTERSGGSDVSATSTIARPQKDGTFRLFGTKWFTSATTSQMAMTLARIEGDTASGSRGLSLFFVELRDPQGRLRQIKLNRLKDKLGTRALPTAELSLEGTPARLVGTPGDGVKKIAALFNITRVYNACCAVGYMRRGIALACDYARKRHAFGKPLADHGLHLETLARLHTDYTAAFLFVFRTVELLGREESGLASPAESATLRLLTPLVKLMTAKQAVATASEVLECFGGAGYVEDTGLPKLLRDSQVLAIWEGTTNVLSLDALRALAREQAGPAFFADLAEQLHAAQHPTLQNLVATVKHAATQLAAYLEAWPQQDADAQTTGARQLALSLARCYMAALLLAHADRLLRHHADQRGYTAAVRWCAEPLLNLLPYKSIDVAQLKAYLA